MTSKTVHPHSHSLPDAIGKAISDAMGACLGLAIQCGDENTADLITMLSSTVVVQQHADNDVEYSWKLPQEDIDRFLARRGLTPVRRPTILERIEAAKKEKEKP